MIFPNHTSYSRVVVSIVLFSMAILFHQATASAQSASFTRTDYPTLGHNHIVADLNGNGIPDLAGTGDWQRKSIFVILSVSPPRFLMPSGHY